MWNAWRYYKDNTGEYLYILNRYMGFLVVVHKGEYHWMRIPAWWYANDNVTKSKED